jgi:glucan phosphoethanolaminetransferase (alkaline phosphatase superfamily)
MADDKKVVVTSGAFPIAGLLGVAFVILKLCGVITWPWLWVLAPFWIPLALVLILLAVAACLFAYAYSGKRA